MACLAEEHAKEEACVVQDVYQPTGQFLDTKAALCIHNIAFQVHICTHNASGACNTLMSTFDCNIHTGI